MVLQMSKPSCSRKRLAEAKVQLAVWSQVRRDEISDMSRYLDAIGIAPGLSFRRDILRNVVRPMLKSAEGNDPDWVIESARQKVVDDGFEVRALNFVLSVDSAVRAPKPSTTM